VRFKGCATFVILRVGGSRGAPRIEQHLLPTMVGRGALDGRDADEPECAPARGYIDRMTIGGAGPMHEVRCPIDGLDSAVRRRRS